MTEKIHGRPGAKPKYTKALIKLARDYIENFRTEYQHEIPSVSGLSIITGINRKTFYEWIKITKEPERADDENLHEIVDILDTINTRQEVELMNNGLNGAFNPAITKLALGKHGYHDKQDNSIQGGFSVTIGDKDAGTL